MTGRREALALLAAVAALALPGCGVAGERLPDFRYRLTVEVETPEGLRTGSSVIEVSTMVAGRYSIPNPGKVIHRVKGEAVTVDLGSRGTLFALLRSDDNVDWAKNVMYRLAPEVPRTRDADGRFDAHRYLHAGYAAMLKRREPIELPRTFPDQAHLRDQPALPMLVRLRDIADPRTVEKVDPDDLAATFGKGVKLRRITMQVTDEPVTTGITNRLAWLGEYPEPRLDSAYEGSTNPNLSQQLAHGDFSRNATQ
jgi:hypothetical protein